ncbi:MAG: nucleoside triphosphate pyrophosphohydrolase [Nitrososphaera sp.]|nr:nucleoside triphosphate pyrophosphohydrolase [Nitrososphaera sp.]
MILPVRWCPSFVGIPKSLHENWLKYGYISWGSLANEIHDWLSKNSTSETYGFLLRSSGTQETLQHRGQYRTETLGGDIDLNDINDAAQRIFHHARSRAECTPIALLLQVRQHDDAKGHFSNETRVSPTRNQWKYETEEPAYGPPKGLNSRFAPRPDPQEHLHVNSLVPHQALRSLGQWMNQTVHPRCHIEWVVGTNCLWVVQVDLEWDEIDHGTDPTVALDPNNFPVPDPSAARVFVPHKIGSRTKWEKLQNLDDFDFDKDGPQPKLYIGTADVLKNAVEERDTKRRLIEEIDLLTAGRAVIRTDILASGELRLNLPRTDTVSGAAAVQWLTNIVRNLRNKVQKPEDIAFLLHAFLPARAAAWAYARPGEPIALVDALWGLPDGLQVLPHDSYQVDVAHEQILSEKIRYKPRFLCEQEDGAWKYVDVLRKKARARSIGRKDAIEIGVRTARIAERLGQNAQIMWFSGIPEQYHVGRNLPWYRARETAEQAPRIGSRYRPFLVKNQTDLRKIPDRPVTIRLNPDAELIREDKFLDEVIQTALSRRLPVELEGSLLSHTYYRLSHSGVAVTLSEPYAKYFRARKRQTFGKLVRDRIPTGIKEGGEQVSEGKLVSDDILKGLIAKLFEEAGEFLDAKDKNARSEELADLLEVICNLASAAAIDWDKVDASAKEKRKQRGGFSERRVLLETSLPKPGTDTDGALEVRLRDISHVTYRDNKVSIPYGALLAQPDGVNGNLVIGGKSIGFKVYISGSAIQLTLRHVDEFKDERAQFSLFP